MDQAPQTDISILEVRRPQLLLCAGPASLLICSCADYKQLHSCRALSPLTGKTRGDTKKGHWPTHTAALRGPAELSETGWACKRGAHLRSEAGKVFQVAADAAGLLDDGVDVELGDLLHEAVFIPFAVLKH